MNGTQFSEKEMVLYFKGTCEAVRAMHDHKEAVPIDGGSSTGRPGRSGAGHEDDGEEPEDDHALPAPDGDEEGGFSYGGAVPLVPRQKKKSGGKTKRVAFEGDEELERLTSDAAPEGPTTTAPPGTKMQHVPYAHRDIKPGYEPTPPFG